MRSFAVRAKLAEAFQTSLLASFPVLVAKAGVKQIKFQFAVAPFSCKKNYRLKVLKDLMRSRGKGLMRAFR